MKKLAIAIALISATSVYAEEPITDDEICEKSIRYAVKYIPEEDAYTLHDARWNILKGDRADDTQKMIGIVLFEMGQRIAYSYDSNIHGEGPDWIREQVSVMAEACEKLIVEMRESSYGEFESANPDEAW